MMALPESRINILVELLHGLGDTICALPMLHTLRSNYPNANLVVVVKFGAAKDLLVASGIFINEVYILDIYKDHLQALYLLSKLQSCHFNYGISTCVTPVKKAKWFMRLIKPQKWIGWQTKNLNFDLLNDRYHFVEANMQAVRTICKLPKAKWYPQLSKEIVLINNFKKQINPDSLNKVIGICVGGGDYSLKNRFLRTGKIYTRDWGINNYLQLINLLLHQTDFKVVLIGGQMELAKLSTLKEILLSDRVFNLVGKTSINESIALSQVCDLVVGVDTGMQHIAAAAGTRTLSIFGPTNPRTHGAYAENSHFIDAEGCAYKYCYGTKKYINCTYRKCLSDIKPEMVFLKIESILSKNFK